ncbi:TRAP-type C4-dicarboxylate transporter [Rhodovulum sp. PH10]|uniref:TRAP transporter small permease n=1 Tax=Rhodovulum sp. PH10 TaxID=1187851 RepID=UPI00027C2730|nr:TRAP transporter small permease [Rhodovulum sp. PH10]EJW13449.1 TRAP-type C4-dicarboxylate transporter [Rhodovulum sp. PH10]
MSVPQGLAGAIALGFSGLNVAVKWILALLMAIMTALTFYQVVMRYGFNDAPAWSEEMVRFLFVWASFVGAAIGVKEGIHIGIDIIYNAVPRPVRLVVTYFIHVVIALFGLAMIVYGWNVVQLTRFQHSPALGLPMSWVYAAVPVMGVLLIVYTAAAIAVAHRTVR